MSNLTYWNAAGKQFELVTGTNGAPTFASAETTVLAPTPATLVSAATTNATVVKASAGTLFTAAISNTTAATIYVKLYNKATAPTVGTDIPVLTLTVVVGDTVSPQFGRLGVRFTAGIALAITGVAAATDTTAVAAGAQVFISYV